MTRPGLPSRRLAIGLTIVLIITRFVLPASLGHAPAVSPFFGWSGLVGVLLILMLLAGLLANRTDEASALITCSALLGASPLYDWLLAAIQPCG